MSNFCVSGNDIGLDTLTLRSEGYIDRSELSNRVLVGKGILI